MARGNQGMNDQLYRTRSRNAAENHREPSSDEKRRRQIRSWIILVTLVVAVLLGIRFLGGKGPTAVRANRLPCYANQNVTPFGDGILYYDGMSLYCLNSAGTVRWSFPAGTGATFSVGPTHVAIWSGMQLYLVDRNGNSTYNESMEAAVQFARVGDRYAAVVVGPDTEPKLLVKDLKGAQVDMEQKAFSGLMLLDAGFYGEQGEYLWTLSLDVFGTAANTILNTFQVGKMLTGDTSLGEALTYSIIYENAKLRVFNTQQMTTYDYRCVQDTNATMLVYGWKLIDYDIPERGSAKMLLAPTSQTNSAQVITELRVLEGNTDKRYTLPDKCVGACIYRGNIYAFSSGYQFRADVNSQKFFVSELPVPEGTRITAFYGVTSDGRALLAAGETMYSLSLPQ
ncbi:MAG: hypothetical protein IKH18_00465 [Clostridia bacterium]|nr:hypothetical protein [Clostridia bacterium]